MSPSHPHSDQSVRPFAAFIAGLNPQSELRAAITAAYRRPEAPCMAPLLDLAALAPNAAKDVAETAQRLVESLRRKQRRGGAEGLIHEYSLSSHEGVALMCLAEAMLRIPDAATRDALIRDKISTGDWAAHVGQSPSLFVNAATWGLVVTGRLTATLASEVSLSAALTRLIGRGGEPLIRKGVDLAMRMMGEQFVTGQTIEKAIANSQSMVTRGFTYSYDMLGEAAMTAEDANRYFVEYDLAARAIGIASAGRGIYEGPGLSIKLSALHPRYSRAKQTRIMNELLPRAKQLALLAKTYDIGINIDAEEADRLEISLDILEALATDPDLSGWNGIGFVIQAYGKRCPYVIDWMIDLARRSKRRLMVRLVKGAYWDTEIKRAQVDGLEDFPVFTRKLHTDVSYLACARKLLAAPDAIFPQFATHNAQTVAAILTMAGPNFYRGQYEFQCLHGMGEPLYEDVVGTGAKRRPCRIYAPVGTHETLLAYLVRRLLENGANSSFVNRIADKAIPIDELIADPVRAVRAMSPVGMPHEQIAHPMTLYCAERANSLGLDLSNEQQLTTLATGLVDSAQTRWLALPSGGRPEAPLAPITNPADLRDVVGHVRTANATEIRTALAAASAADSRWAATAPAHRAACLSRAADMLEARMPILMGLIVREAGKSFSNAVAEVREAVDFLRYYGAEAAQLRDGDLPGASGPVVCISPWNFPLAIFAGQVAAALAAGRPVLAKPAEETPLIAAEAVRILHESGIPQDVLHLVPGAGDVGAALVADDKVMGVMFTGSTAVARLIQRQLSTRLTPTAQPISFIAETGGQNAIVVDSSALAEQVVADVIASAFDSAGQRCSALRILCLQEDVADRILDMLGGAMRELEVGNPDRLSVDVGPVITTEARDGILAHIETMRTRGHRVESLPLPDGTGYGTFVAPTIIEINRISDVEREVFGPVLHVLRYRRRDLDKLIDDINATGYGLTFGLHTRIDETTTRVVGKIEAGNIYVNRNIIGAVVGTQPFGGVGLSGTGPKAGGPLYLSRLMGVRPNISSGSPEGAASAQSAARSYIDWLQVNGETGVAERCKQSLSSSLLGARVELAGPVGERNVYALRPRGRVAALARTKSGLLVQLGSIFATGNEAVVERQLWEACKLDALPAQVVAKIVRVDDWRWADSLRGILFEGEPDALLSLLGSVAEREGAILSVQSTLPGECDYDHSRLLEEYCVSTNTAAAGGNASLMSIG